MDTSFLRLAASVFAGLLRICCHWKTEGCHSHLIEADILLTFTLSPFLDTRIKPALLVGRLPLVGRLGVLEQLPGGLQCWSSVSLLHSNASLRRFLLFVFVYHLLADWKPWLATPQDSSVSSHREPQVCDCLFQSLFYMIACEIGFKWVLPVLLSCVMMIDVCTLFQVKLINS